jgi:hypothetical protein
VSYPLVIPYGVIVAENGVGWGVDVFRESRRRKVVSSHSRLHELANTYGATTTHEFRLESGYDERGIAGVFTRLFLEIIQSVHTYITAESEFKAQQRPFAYGVAYSPSIKNEFGSVFL